MRQVIPLLFLFGVLGTTISGAAESIYQSDQDWVVTKTPESLGYSATALDEVTKVVEAGRTTSLLVTVGEDLLYHRGDSAKVSYIASCRKSVMAILYGKYVQSGVIDLGATLADLGMDDIHELLPIEKKATVRDLITARSGVYHPASNGGDSREFAPERGTKEPGTYYLYNNWDFNVAGAVLEKQIGQNVYDVYAKDLAAPLGFQDFVRKRHKKTGDQERSQYLAYHFHVSNRDMARIGYLMLNDGQWFGEQVVDADWIKTIRTTFTPLEELNPPGMRKGNFAYAYMWWTYHGDDERLAGAYLASGYYGQFILVVPEFDMVLAHKTAPSTLERIKHEDDPDTISVSTEKFMEMVMAVLDAKQD